VRYAELVLLYVANVFSVCFLQLVQAVTLQEEIKKEMADREKVVKKALGRNPQSKALNVFLNETLIPKSSVTNRILGQLQKLLNRTTPVDMKMSNWSGFFTSMTPTLIKKYMGLFAMGR
jgi:hypothetical protein